LEAIQKGNIQLNKVDPSTPRPGEKSPAPPTGLADTLARAMAERRGALRQDVVEPDNDNDSDWSDGEWE
jgi:hypothetical protein